MNLYLQYHNVRREGLILSSPPFTESKIRIRTRVALARKARGRVLLICGLGTPRQFFLWESFEIEGVHSTRDGGIEVFGPGWQLAPPQRLAGESLEDFRRFCANFVGFRNITDHPYSTRLLRLADAYRPPCKPRHAAAFLEDLLDLLPRDSDARRRIHRELGSASRETPRARSRMPALSIRQPNAEAILRGVKRIEYRTRPTNVRGRVLIYASKSRYSPAEEEEYMKSYGITDISRDELPRGVLVGSVEIHHCEGGQWHLRHPLRARKLLRPKRMPQPIWFYPFE